MNKCFSCTSVIFLNREGEITSLAPPQYIFSAAAAKNSSYFDQSAMIQATEPLCNLNDFLV